MIVIKTADGASRDAVHNNTALLAPSFTEVTTLCAEFHTHRTVHA